MEKLKFYNVRRKASFEIDQYEVEKKESTTKTGKKVTRYMAKAKDPADGQMCYRILSKDQGEKMLK
tara:strand:- start:296 stop:493 length:198 start_codon:yes stop_codon:yes gene_type:complete